MNYQKKYTKYKEQYLNLKIKYNSQIGGGDIIMYDDLNFLHGWNKIIDVGQHNCGIFLSGEQPKKLATLLRASPMAAAALCPKP